MKKVIGLIAASLLLCNVAFADSYTVDQNLLNIQYTSNSAFGIGTGGSLLQDATNAANISSITDNSGWSSDTFNVRQDVTAVQSNVNHVGGVGVANKLNQTALNVANDSGIFDDQGPSNSVTVLQFNNASQFNSNRAVFAAVGSSMTQTALNQQNFSTVELSSGISANTVLVDQTQTGGQTNINFAAAIGAAGTVSQIGGNTANVSTIIELP